MLYWTLLALVFGLLIGIFLHKFLMSPPIAGKLKIAVDDVDGPYFFMEMSSATLQQLSQEKYIVLEVDRVKDVSPK